MQKRVKAPEFVAEQKDNLLPRPERTPGSSAVQAIVQSLQRVKYPGIYTDLPQRMTPHVCYTELGQTSMKQLRQQNLKLNVQT